MSIEAMKQALEALERLNDIDGMYSWVDTEQALRQAIEQAEKQEPDLPPVFIGVDVTLKGTQVNAFYRRPNDVAEMFYSEFHPLAKPEQEPIAWMCENAVGYKYFRWKKPTSHYKPIALYTSPPRKEWVGLTDEEVIEWVESGEYNVITNDWASHIEFARAIEAKLKERNT